MAWYLNYKWEAEEKQILHSLHEMKISRPFGEKDF